MNKLKATIILLVMTMDCLCMKAAETDSTSLHPSFGVEYTGEIQTDFKRVRQANLLHLSAEIPLSSALSFEVGSLSIHSFNKELVADDLQGYSNINADDLPFALTVAGFNWQINDHHSVFAGIRRTDEDYFCSDGLALLLSQRLLGAFIISTIQNHCAYRLRYIMVLVTTVLAVATMYSASVLRVMAFLLLDRQNTAIKTVIITLVPAYILILMYDHPFGLTLNKHWHPILPYLPLTDTPSVVTMYVTTSMA